MLKHSSPIVNSIVRSERCPTNSESTLYIFMGYTGQCKRSSRRNILKSQLEEKCGSLKLTMELTGMKTSDNTPYKYFTRTTMSLAELTALHPSGIMHEDNTKLGAFVLHKKAVWRSSYRSVSDLSTAKQCASEKILCFIERIDHDTGNCQVHQQANFLIETFKAHPIAGKYLQGLSVYKNIHTDQDKCHSPDTIVEFAVHQKTGKYFAALLKSFCQSCDQVKLIFGVYKRKNIMGNAEWV